MKNNQYKYYSLILAVALIFVSGCMVGPKYKRPATVADNSMWSFKISQYNSDTNSPGRWWLRFNDSVTNSLVKKALEKNYDLSKAAAKVLQARSDYKIAGGKLWPDADIDFGRKFTRQSSGPPGSATEDSATIDKKRTYSAELTISYVLDLFGRLEHDRRSKFNDLLAAEADQNAVINSMIASVINARINIAVYQNQLDIAKANTQSMAKTLDIVEERYKKGLVGPVDVRLARENLAAAQVTEPQIELNLKIAQSALDVLLAEPVGKTTDFENQLAELPLPQVIPLGIPATVLARRPDVLKAEYDLISQNEQIGVSIAEMYPDLTLTASMGWSSNKSDRVFVDQAWLYSTLFSAAQPLFKGGQLKAQVQKDKAKFAELAAVYSKTVAEAMKEVYDEAVTEGLLRKKLEFAQIRFAEAKAAEELSRQRYKRGVESILTVLESERRRNTAQESLALLKGQIWNARVNLFLAIGGDWISIKDKPKLQENEDGKK